MNKRISVKLPDKTNLRERLKTEALANAERDLAITAEWFLVTADTGFIPIDTKQLGHQAALEFSSRTRDRPDANLLIFFRTVLETANESGTWSQRIMQKSRCAALPYTT